MNQMNQYESNQPNMNQINQIDQMNHYEPNEPNEPNIDDNNQSFVKDKNIPQQHALRAWYPEPWTHAMRAGARDPFNPRMHAGVCTHACERVCESQPRDPPCLAPPSAAVAAGCPSPTSLAERCCYCRPGVRW